MALKGTPLPPKLPSEIYTLSPNIDVAYLKILQLEKSINPKNVMYARILGYLLLHGPSDEARKTVAGEVVYCASDDQLAKNGKFYYDYYICAFRRFKGHTPTTSSHPSQPDSNELKSMLLLKETPRSHEAVKQQALFRDGYHCHVTGYYDLSATKDNPEVQQKVRAAGASIRIRSTQCTHIFNSSTNWNLGDEGSHKHDYASSVWAVMDRFGYKDILHNLNGDKIHHLDNILTLEPGIHDLFDRLEIWFEPTAKQHEYMLGATAPELIYGLEKPVKFTTPDPDKYPLPSPCYLNIHATCAKIAHLSGAGEYIDKILRDLEDTKVLSKDGASAEVLDHLFLPLSHDLSVYQSASGPVISCT